MNGKYKRVKIKFSTISAKYFLTYNSNGINDRFSKKNRK